MSPVAQGFQIALVNPAGAREPITLDLIVGLSSDEVDDSVRDALSRSIQAAGRFEFSADSQELSQDVHEAFSRDEIETPLVKLENGHLIVSNLCIAAARSGNLAELAGLDHTHISALNIPEYTPLKARIQAHKGVEHSDFALDLEVLDLNGVPKRLTPFQGHVFQDEDRQRVFLSPYFHRLLSRHDEHRVVRKSDKYRGDSQLRFKELGELRKAALNAEIRIDPFVKSQNIVFLKTLPYVIGRGPDERVHLNPALPEEHSKLDQTFQAILESNADEVRPALINIQTPDQGVARVVLSDDAWSDVKKIKTLKSQGQTVLEDVFEDPEKFFGRKPRATLAQTFSDRVSGFIIGKLTSNRADSNSGNDWGQGYEGASTLLRAADGSTIPLTYSPMPPEYEALKRVCNQLSEKILNDEANLRSESGAILTPVPTDIERRVFVDELKGEFNLSELETCCSRIEYSNRIELEPEDEARAREVVEIAEGNNQLTVEWGRQEDGKPQIIPVSSLRASLPQIQVNSSDQRVSLDIDEHSTRLGTPPDWNYRTCDLALFSRPPHFREKYELEEHQRKGFAWLAWLFEHSIDLERYSHRGALLADDMGLGKTIQLLAFVAWLRAKPQYGEKPILIVAPVSLIQSSWLEDGFNKFFEDKSVFGLVSDGLGPIVRFSDCPIKIDRDLLLAEAQRVNSEISSSSKPLAECEIDESLKLQLHGIDEWAKGKIVITSYETLRINSLALGSVNFAAVILDEAQKIKNVGVLQSNAAKALKAEMCIAMTGTPIENSLMDLWSIMDFVLPGHLGSKTSSLPTLLIH